MSRSVFSLCAVASPRPFCVPSVGARPEADTEHGLQVGDGVYVGGCFAEHGAAEGGVGCPGFGGDGAQTSAVGPEGCVDSLGDGLGGARSGGCVVTQRAGEEVVAFVDQVFLGCVTRGVGHSRIVGRGLAEARISWHGGDCPFHTASHVPVLNRTSREVYSACPHTETPTARIGTATVTLQVWNSPPGRRVRPAHLETQSWTTRSPFGAVSS